MEINRGKMHGEIRTKWHHKESNSGIYLYYKREVTLMNGHKGKLTTGDKEKERFREKGG